MGGRLGAWGVLAQGKPCADGEHVTSQAAGEAKPSRAALPSTAAAAVLVRSLRRPNLPGSPTGLAAARERAGRDRPGARGRRRRNGERTACALLSAGESPMRTPGADRSRRCDAPPHLIRRSRGHQGPPRGKRAARRPVVGRASLVGAGPRGRDVVHLPTAFSRESPGSRWGTCERLGLSRVL